MKKGVVLSIDRNQATVFTQDCGLETIDLAPNMKMGREAVLPASSRPQKMRLAWAAAAMLAVLVLILGILVGTGRFLSPVYATLSVDVNPSIELDLNRSLDVIRVRALNDEAAALLQGQELRKMNWEDAVTHWTELVDAKYPLQERTVLLSAVLPEGAEQLRIRLLALEKKLQQGPLVQEQVRVVYSHDEAVRKTADQNGLSVGRQMLLNQSDAKQMGWDPETIQDAPLGELVRNLLKDEDEDQTRLTSHQTNRQTETLQTGETSGSGTQATQRETNRETSASSGSSQSGTGSTIRQTDRETSQEPSGTTSQARETSQAQEPSGSTQTQASGETSHNSDATQPGSTSPGPGSTQQGGSQG